MLRCSCVRTGENPKKMPGEQRVYRCPNEATRLMRVHQENEHGRVGTGWFEVALCDPCFLTRSEANAIVKLRGQQPWRWAR